jgi:hypothetical protein
MTINPSTAPSSASACFRQNREPGTAQFPQGLQAFGQEPARQNAMQRFMASRKCDGSGWTTGAAAYTRIFAVSPLPPVDDTNLMRTNFACTFATVRPSPAVAVVVSIV